MIVESFSPVNRVRYISLNICGVISKIFQVSFTFPGFCKVFFKINFCSRVFQGLPGFLATIIIIIITTIIIILIVVVIIIILIFEINIQFLITLNSNNINKKRYTKKRLQYILRKILRK